MINMMDLDGITRANVGYIVLHRDFIREFFDKGALAQYRPNLLATSDQLYEVVPLLVENYERFWGAPFFEDSHVVVFKIHSSQKEATEHRASAAICPQVRLCDLASCW